MKLDALNSPRLQELKKRRQNDFRNKILLCMAAVLVVLAGLAYISRLPKLNISGVGVVGNKIVDTDAVKQVVQADTAGNYLLFFPRTNILLYPENRIQNDLHNTFKRLKDINFSIKDGNVLQVSTTERAPLYTWCGATMEVVDASSEKCNFLDADGYMFDEAPYFSGEVYFKFYGKLPTDFNGFISFKKDLENMGLKPVGLYVQDDGDMKVFLSNGSSSLTGAYIILTSGSDLENVAENLQAALTTEPLQSKFKTKYSSLQYIDLRFGNKVYYKFK